VELVALAGDRIVIGFAGAVMGRLDAPGRATARRPAQKARAARRKGSRR
jgi:hypothetical protein